MGQVTQEGWLDGIQKGLTAELMKHDKALPNGFNRERFILNSITVIRDMLRDSKKKDSLQKIDYSSIPICLAKGAYLGLDFFNGECYAIPYGGEMKFQTDYKGEIKLCKRYSQNQIKDIYAKVVREGDYFSEVIDGGIQNVCFKPIPFSNANMIGAFAVVVFKDGSMMYDTMGKEEIENVRQNYSKAQNSQAWRVSTGEMYKKTVLRRLCKMIDLDFDNIEQQIAYDVGGDAEFKNSISENGQTALPDKGAPVDVFAQARAEQANQEKQKEPVPVSGGNQAAEEEDYRRFEQFEQQNQHDDIFPVDDGYSIPDDNDFELPFR